MPSFEPHPVEPRILERAQHCISRRAIDSRVLSVMYRLIGDGHTAYLVGGSVRDLLMGRKPKDFDVATSAHPAQVRRLFRNSRLIGRRFPLVHVFFGRDNIEVSTFRRHDEALAGTQDPLIQRDNCYGTPQDDAFRRDFTVNALFYDPRTGRVLDYAGGLEDLRGRQIRAIGVPELRMREDPPRMLRAVRFAAKLGFVLEAATRAAVERWRADLLRAAPARLALEIHRALAIAAAPQAFAMMRELGLMEVALPLLDAYLAGLADSAADGDATARNLAALGLAIAQGLEATPGFALACLFADFYLRQEGRAERWQEAAAMLRSRGVSRASVDEAGRLLQMLLQMLTRPERLPALARRRHFAAGLRLYRLLVLNYAAVAAGSGERGALGIFSGDGARRRRRRWRRGRKRVAHRRALQEPAQPEAFAEGASQGAVWEKG